MVEVGLRSSSRLPSPSSQWFMLSLALLLRSMEFFFCYSEVNLWSTTFSFVSVGIIDESGEAKPKRLQAEWRVKEVRGVDWITQALHVEVRTSQLQSQLLCWRMQTELDLSVDLWFLSLINLFFFWNCHVKKMSHNFLKPKLNPKVFTSHWLKLSISCRNGNKLSCLKDKRGC